MSEHDKPDELPPIDWATDPLTPWIEGTMSEHDKPQSIGFAPRDSKTFAIQFLATVAAMRGESVVFVNPKPPSPEIVPSPT